MCGICKAHVDDAISVISVSSSRKYEETEIITEEVPDEAARRSALERKVTRFSA